MQVIRKIRKTWYKYKVCRSRIKWKSTFRYRKKTGRKRITITATNSK